MVLLGLHDEMHTCISLGFWWYRISEIASEESELFVTHSVLIVHSALIILKRETI